MQNPKNDENLNLSPNLSPGQVSARVGCVKAELKPNHVRSERTLEGLYRGAWEQPQASSGPASETHPNSTIFKIFRNSSRTRTETPQERAAGAQHLRSPVTVLVAIPDRCSRATQKHYEVWRTQRGAGLAPKRPPRD